MNANSTMPTNKFTVPSTLIECLKQFGIAALYMLFGYVIHLTFTSNGIVGVIWPGSGLALAAILIGGKRYLWSILCGSLLLNALSNNSFWAVFGMTLANVLEALLGSWLLMRNNRSAFSFRMLSDYLQLIAFGAVASITSAVIGVFSLLLAGTITSAEYFGSALIWWMDDMLGVVLVTPFILAWWQTKPERFKGKQLIEEVLLVGITVIAGQIIFLGWLNDSLIIGPKGFMMFLFIAWVAIRLGIRPTTFVLNIIAIQALSGAYLNVGYFANEIAITGFYNYWIYMLILSGVGMVLAVYVNEIKQKELSLRASETHLRLSQVNGGIGTWEADHITNKQKWSENCVSLLGFPNLSEPRWEDFLAAAHPEDRQKLIDAIQSHNERGTKYEVEYRIVANGGIRWMRSAGQVKRDADGKLTMMRGIVQDVTERKQVQQSLQDKEQMLSESQRIAHIGSWSMELATGCISWSDEMYQIYGITKDTFGHSVNEFLDLIYPGDREAMKMWVSDCLAGMEPQELDFRIMLPGGTIRFIRGSGGLQYDELKRPLRMVGSAQDITERKQAELVLNQLKAMIDTTLDGFWIVDLMGNLLQVNEAYANISGYSIDELMNMHIIQLEAIEGSKQVKAHILKIVTQGYDLFETRHRHKDGHTIDIEVSAAFLAEFQQFCVFCRDITERKRIESDLRIAAIAFESQEGMFVTDAHKVILRVNRAFTKITGYSAEDVIGKTPRRLQSGRHDADFYAAMWESINSTGAWEGEIWNRRKTGEVYPEHLTITSVIVADSIVSHYVATLTDITMNKAAVDEIERLAFYDPLTGLPNRRLLWDRLKLALASSHRSGRKGALLFIDMDNFKTLNDTLGHDMGDSLLQQVAQRLEFCVRKGDTIARLGGDEFVMMLEDLSEQALEAAAQTEVVGDKILAALIQPYQLSTHDYHSTSSIGATLFNGHEQPIDELLKQADIAMYQAKCAGRNTLRFFDKQMQISISARVALEADLRLALAENQFMLYYQPQIDRNRQIISAEVLIRWQHPLRGLLLPAVFIPLAEEIGLIFPIGQWVLETACAQIKIWEGNVHTRHLQLAVNVSARQFRQTNFVEQVSQILRRNAINPDRLKLEITESLVLDDIDDSVRKMNALREIGVRFSLDDFGTGYSSLAYLTQLPLDQLKIDRSFVHNIGIKTTDAVIVQTIIGMANNLGMEVIAEGVETEAQRIFLERLNCKVCQGYLFSKPVPIEQFESLQKHC